MLWLRTLFTPKDPGDFAVLVRDWLLAMGHRGVTIDAESNMLSVGPTRLNPQNLHFDLLHLPRLSRQSHLTRKLTALLEQQPGDFPKNFALVRNRVMPVVRQAT